MKSLLYRLALAGLAACPAFAVFALPPDQVFERASPGIWALRTLDPNNQPFNHGTAVAIAPGKAVTSCSVLIRAHKVELLRDKVVLPATLEYPDAARDLCQLDVPGLQAAEPVRAAPRMGQRVFAIGYERGTDISIADGLFTRSRESGTDGERIQTNVPNSGGLAGAGLYDEEARLLGIVAASPADASSVVFALPAKWLAELAERGRAALAARAAAPAKSAGGLPTVGTSWNYNYVFRGLGGMRLQFQVRVDAVEGQLVRESIAIGGSPAQSASARGDFLGFRSLPLPRSQMLIEFSPYLHSVLRKNESRPWGTVAGYPLGNPALLPWRLTVRELAEEEVSVPAGTYRATQVEVAGRRQVAGTIPFHLAQESSRFLFRAWYAPEVQRYVKLQHETWNLRGEWSGEQIVELNAYSVK